MQMRPYQREFLDAIRTDWDAGERRQLGVLATGGGKSVIIGEIPNTVPMSKDEQMAVFVHREELVEQNAAKLRRCNPDLRVEVEQAEKRASPDANVIVASIPTIGRLKKQKEGAEQFSLLETPTRDIPFSDRLTKFDPDRVRIVVTDEAHHGTADTYLNVYRYFNVLNEAPGNDSTKLHLGVTATPNRADNVGLEKLYTKLTYSKDLMSMIPEWLTDIIAFRVTTNVDISQVATRLGDFATGDLERKVNVAERNRVIVEKYLSIAPGEIGVAFTVDVAHTMDLTAEFLKAGVPAAGLTGKTPKDERREILRLHAEGKLKMLCACGILNEGWDLPQCIVGLMARPTKSSLLYQQQVGRLCRPFPSPEDLDLAIRRGMPPRYIKRNAIIIDFVDVSGRHRLNTVPSLFGLPQDFDLEGSSAKKQLEEVEKVIKESKGAAQIDMFKNLRDLKSFAEKIDLFAAPQIPPEIKRFSKLSWIGGGTGYYELQIPSEDYTSFRVSMNTLGAFEIHRVTRGFRKLLETRPTLETALAYGDSIVPPDSLVVLRTNAAWRQDKPSEKQIKWLAKNRPDMRRQFTDYGAFEIAMATRYTKGDISQMIASDGARRSG